MGMYDIINLPNHPSGGGQVKLFDNEMVTYTIGDRVPLAGTYGIVLREGGVVLVKDGVITGWLQYIAEVLNNPAAKLMMAVTSKGAPSVEIPLYDKYGSTWTPDTKGELSGVLNDPYFFEKKR